MKILVDADACPVIKNIENIAKSKNIKVILFSDTNHILRSDYSEIKVIGDGNDAVDFAIMKYCDQGDIVVTQDYGLASLVMAKNAYGIHHTGKLYTEDNIDFLLMSRYINKRERLKGVKIHKKKYKNDVKNQNKCFEKSLIKLINKGDF